MKFFGRAWHFCRFNFCHQQPLNYAESFLAKMKQRKRRTPTDRKNAAGFCKTVTTDSARCLKLWGLKLNFHARLNHD